MSARFMSRVDSESEAVLTVEGKSYAYVTLPDEVAEAVRAEAAGWEMVITSEQEKENEDYGTYYVKTTEEAITVTEIGSLSEKTSSYFIPVGDMLVEDGKFIGVVSYCGHNTNRYGYHSIIPISADPYYGIEPPYMRPDPGEVEHKFGVFYTNGDIEGACRGMYSNWESRSNSYNELKYSLRKKK